MIESSPWEEMSRKLAEEADRAMRPRVSGMPTVIFASEETVKRLEAALGRARESRDRSRPDSIRGADG
jgi:hypothetical protein